VIKRYPNSVSQGLDLLTTMYLISDHFGHNFPIIESVVKSDESLIPVGSYVIIISGS
jgi:hypothetical protein